MTLQCLDTLTARGRELDVEWPVAGVEIPVGSYLGPVSEVCLQPEEQELPDTTANIVKVYVKNNRLTSKNGDDMWARRLPAARDLHEQNVVVCRGQAGRLYIRTVRVVAPGSILRGWYDDGLAIELNIPYLTPSHIRGVQDYRCNTCMRAFKYPNLLKLHLKLQSCTPSCQRWTTINSQTCRKIASNVVHSGDEMITPRNITSLKQKLHFQRQTSMSANQCDQTKMIKEFPFKHFVKSSTLRRQNGGENEDISKLCLPEYPSSHQTSWLNKEQSLPNSFNCSQSTQSEPYILKTSVSAIPGITVTGVREDGKSEGRARFLTCVNHLGSTDAYRCFESPNKTLEAVQKSFIELTRRKGHMCVYCGKFYSRKYGLKIHLRTHTGYKPLKCKICSRAFGDPSNLNKHVRLHADGNTPYTCSQCGKVLVRRRDLLRHMRSRHSIVTDSPDISSVD